MEPSGRIGPWNRKPVHQDWIGSPAPPFLRNRHRTAIGTEWFTWPNGSLGLQILKLIPFARITYTNRLNLSPSDLDSAYSVAFEYMP